jgi:hypothetical protein
MHFGLCDFSTRVAGQLESQLAEDPCIVVWVRVGEYMRDVRQLVND